MAKILVTGAAGFIGFHLVQQLLGGQDEVIGLDNINDYYDINLKYSRLNELGVKRENVAEGVVVSSSKYDKFGFIKSDLENKKVLFELFADNKFDIVVNLAAQAGVRYSIENPDVYVQSDVVGFLNVLEACRNFPVEHLIYASSSSIYGLNSKIPFSTEDRTDNPVSLYAATKKANELMAHTYSHLYNIKTTGLRFFTVYGPWGRPDMAPMLFADTILKGKPINVFNNGNLERDFTYVGDIVNGVKLVISKNANTDRYSLFNIANTSPVKLMDFINILEKEIGKKAEKIFLPMQKGDVYKTWADCTPLEVEFNYAPKVSIEEGVRRFIDWYIKYYGY